MRRTTPLKPHTAASDSRDDAPAPTATSLDANTHLPLVHAACDQSSSRPNGSLSAILAAKLAPQLESLSQPLTGIVTAMFITGTGPDTLDSLAYHAGMTRRTLDRRFRRAGFTSGRLVLVSTRIARTYESIISSVVPMRRIAEVLGYTLPRSLDNQILALFGYRCSYLRVHPLPADVAAATIASKLVIAQHGPFSVMS